MPRHSLRIAPLLFVSGLCALIYQVAWLRELRLVFGASTPATAAVLGVFMGGLGYGSLVLSRRADRVRRPLLLYANLEAGVTAFAALTPLLLTLTRSGYTALGGTTELGMFGGTVVRLALSAVVLLPPTLLMGGTLPAAARAAIGAEDPTRRTTALLYGVNTLGAVTGATVATFVMLELYGTRHTLWIGCLLNGLVAIAARLVDRSLPSAAAPSSRPEGGERAEPEPKPSRPTAARAHRSFVLVAAGAVGFVFLLMELVWYRMLSPLLGGSTYTFGLILAVALAGIGLGGVLYTRRSATRPVLLRAFAWTCVLEGVLVAVPYALGDRVAFLALFFRSFGVLGLGGHALAWTVVTAAVVLPASMVAGYQFPLLIALLGEGRQKLGRHVGLAYACNTLGAIAGSLLGGFVLLPGLGALGAWRLCALLLLALAAAAGVTHLFTTRPAGGSAGTWLAQGAAAVACALLVFAPTGPTAMWRHSPIGTGRSDSVLHNATRNSLRSAVHERRRAVTWEAEGRESSIGLYTLNDTSFLVNGKSDGAAVLDGGTQVMGGLLGALLHPAAVRRALVIGLGTGSTAGWLGRLPGIERVDVVELEPAMVEVARICAPVNAGVLDNPKVHIVLGDAREVLLTTPRRYDLIFSEPSNPYRAGIASLFTREFYRAVADRLSPDGVFVQWVQAYEIDAQSVRTVYATLAAVFHSVESWRTKDSDLMLINRAADWPVDVAQLRQRIGEEPYRSALMAVWRTHRLEGVLARYVAHPSFARAVAAAAGPQSINTDDRNLLEFAIARALGRPDDFRVAQLLQAAADRGERQPSLTTDGDAPNGGAETEIEWSTVQDEMMAAGLVQGSRPWLPKHPALDEAQEHRLAALRGWVADEPEKVIEHWEAQDRDPDNAVELMVLADAYAVQGRDEAWPLIERLDEWQPIEADAITARMNWARRRWDRVLPPLRRMIEGHRYDPWPNSQLLSRALALGLGLAERDPSLAVAVYELLGPTFAVSSLSYLRRAYRLDLALLAQDGPRCVGTLDEIGPHIPWYKAFLLQRIDCYRLAAHPGLAGAEVDLAEYVAGEGQDFARGLPTADPAAR